MGMGEASQTVLHPSNAACQGLKGSMRRGALCNLKKFVPVGKSGAGMWAMSAWMLMSGSAMSARRPATTYHMPTSQKLVIISMTA